MVTHSTREAQRRHHLRDRIREGARPFNGGKDGCQLKTNNVLTNYTCPSGFSPVIRPGPDQCVKPGNPSVLAPSVAKSI